MHIASNRGRILRVQQGEYELKCKSIKKSSIRYSFFVAINFVLSFLFGGNAIMINRARSSLAWESPSKGSLAVPIDLVTDATQASAADLIVNHITHARNALSSPSFIHIIDGVIKSVYDPNGMVPIVSCVFC